MMRLLAAFCYDMGHLPKSSQVEVKGLHYHQRLIRFKGSDRHLYQMPGVPFHSVLSRYNWRAVAILRRPGFLMITDLQNAGANRCSALPQGRAK